MRKMTLRVNRREIKALGKPGNIRVNGCLTNALSQDSTPEIGREKRKESDE